MSSQPAVTLYPLGGLGEIGLNCMAMVSGDSMILVDCGLMFPDDSLFGIDVVIPRFDFLLANKDKLQGIILTHGHEDHIGALPWLMEFASYSTQRQNRDRHRAGRATRRVHCILIGRHGRRQMEYAANMKALNSIDRQVFMHNHIGKLESFPEEIILLPTMRCNYNCVTCTQNHSDAREYPESFLKELADILPFARFVNITGGEPLLYKHFDELVSLITSRHCTYWLVTNGSLLNENWRQKLLDSTLQTIKFSIDGGSPQAYSRIRTVGNFFKVMQNITEFMSNLRFSQVLLKISGEALAGGRPFGIDNQTVTDFARGIVDAAEAGARISLVIGGGNIFRGVSEQAAGMGTPYQAMESRPASANRGCPVESRTACQ